MDEKRILSKIGELNSYLEEIDQIKPLSFDEYEKSISDKRAIERILQICVETVIDVCNIIISGFKLGIPSDEEDAINRLAGKNVISRNMAATLIEMKGFRNHLIHKYGDVQDERVFENLDNLDDFEKFKEEIVNFLKKQEKKKRKH